MQRACTGFAGSAEDVQRAAGGLQGPGGKQDNGICKEIAGSRQRRASGLQENTNRPAGNLQRPHSTLKAKTWAGGVPLGGLQSARPLLNAEKHGHGACGILVASSSERACPSHTLPPAPRSPLFGPPGRGKTLPDAVFFSTSFSVAPKVAPGLQNGARGCPKGGPKTPTSDQNDLPRGAPKKRQKKRWKGAFPADLDMQSAHARAVQTRFSVFAPRPEK